MALTSTASSLVLEMRKKEIRIQARETSFLKRDVGAFLSIGLMLSRTMTCSFWSHSKLYGAPQYQVKREHVDEEDSRSILSQFVAWEMTENRLPKQKWTNFEMELSSMREFVTDDKSELVERRLMRRYA